ncbi:peptidoglycan editing factor PgeF [Fusibacter bizertensis]
MRNFKNIKALHGITTRNGGVSVGAFASMNTSFFGIDDPKHVYTNIKIALDEIGIKSKTIIATQQVHSNKVLNIDEAFDFRTLKSIDTSNSDLQEYKLFVSPETDGLMTFRDDIVLMTFYADCVPLVYEDELTGLIATVHSGWRGTAHLMAQEVVKYLIGNEMKVEQLRIGIGHCAGICCYEVDDPVVDAFRVNYSNEQLGAFIIPKENGKYMIDLKQANAIALMKQGIALSQIEINPECTICNAVDFHSHRRTGYPRGSMSTFIAKK